MDAITYETLISYETMLATRAAANSAWWSACAAIISVFTTLAALGLAFTTLESWKEQERFKVKIEFKRAILEIKYSLESMPARWTYHQVNIARARLKSNPEVANRIGDESDIFFKKQELVSLYNNASKAWVMCGHLFSEGNINEDWREFKCVYQDYILKGGETNKPQRIIDRMCAELKVL
ncbi:hypothetical protein J8628_03165 [Serratia fonticola]|uniref:hypothetical protein n=1 Tax=Serratia fonticola TaxID=47917 RepID=UPI001AE8FC13|nr:hypothetical protein [Serratia fonticola]MBP1015907.1 hypothetical protein [Serratia fonticola]